MQKAPAGMSGLFVLRDLTMTYFRMGNPYYHRRGAVSRSCSGWEGVGPARYARQGFCGSVPTRERKLPVSWLRHSGEVKIG